jgi:hypothetical protein
MIQHYEGEVRQPGEQAHMERLIREARATPVRTVNPDDDDEMRALVAHCLVHQGRTLTLREFYATYGLSKAQARTMTKAEISAFCLQAEKNNANDPAAPSPAWETKKVPQRFTLENPE